MILAGRSVLLTGATGGLGRTIARTLAGRGAQLILTGRRADELEALAAETGGRGLPMDLSAPAAADTLLEQAGRVDVLVANAGLPGTGRLEDFTVSEIDRALAVNLRTPMLLARALAPAMVERGEGHMLFMSSLAGRSATPRSTVYNATKFGLRGFALALRADLVPHGVGVSIVYPGFIRDAGMFADAGVTLPPGVGTKAPGDVADAVVRAIERNRAEVDVAPMLLRVGALLAGVAPEAVRRVSRRLGADRLADEHAVGQVGKR